jgi:hypothetical protein
MSRILYSTLGHNKKRNDRYNTKNAHDRKHYAPKKHGIIVLLPKTTNPTTPEHYRALTLLNADIKIVARIIANRLKDGYQT